MQSADLRSVPQKNKKTPFGHKLAEIVRKNVMIAAGGGKVISNATIEKRWQVIKLAFSELREDGYRLETPMSFRNRHMEHLVRKWEARGLSASTIQLRVSIMRTFSEWIGKPGMVLAPERYLENQASGERSYVATEDKSWDAKNVDAEKIIRQLEANDVYVAAQLKAILAFGLRRKEAVMLRPHRADKGTVLSVSDGTKGGRDRMVLIDTPVKRAVIDQLKAFVKTHDGHLGSPALSLDQNLSKISRVMHSLGINKKVLGVTLHGLRHQYLNDRYEEIAGVPSPVRGGEITPDNHAAVVAARSVCAEEAGHTRLSITTAYYGPTKMVQKNHE